MQTVVRPLSAGQGSGAPARRRSPAPLLIETEIRRPHTLAGVARRSRALLPHACPAWRAPVARLLGAPLATSCGRSG
jgi:hypothetical protein